METRAILVSPAALLAAAAFASTDACRPVLCGVHVAPDGTCTATDGHRLLSVPGLPDMAAMLADYPTPADDTQGDAIGEGGIIIPAPAAIAAAKAAPKKPRVPCLGLVRLTVHGATVRLYSTNLDAASDARVTAIEGPYPNFEQVFPKGEADILAGFNADYLAGIGKACKGLAAGPVHSMTWEFRKSTAHGPDDDPRGMMGAAAFTVPLENGLTARGLLMPLRLKAAEYTAGTV